MQHTSPAVGSRCDSSPSSPGSGSITRILAYPGELTQVPHIAPAARGPPWEEDFDTREGDTSALSEPLPEYEFDQRVSW